MSTDNANAGPRFGRGPRRPPRTLKQHLIRRLLIVVPAFLLMFAIVRSGLLDMSYDKITFGKLSWFDNTALVEHLRVRVIQDRLTDLPRNCIVFVVNGDASVNNPEIEVLGRHGHGCPGATPSADRLFMVKVNRTEQSITTDAGTPGVFRPIQP